MFCANPPRGLLRLRTVMTGVVTCAIEPPEGARLTGFGSYPVYRCAVPGTDPVARPENVLPSLGLADQPASVLRRFPFEEPASFAGLFDTVLKRVAGKHDILTKNVRMLARGVRRPGEPIPRLRRQPRGQPPAVHFPPDHSRRLPRRRGGRER